MTISRPGCLSPQEFNRLFVIAITIFFIFMLGVATGSRIERNACNEAINSSDHIVIPHFATIIVDGVAYTS